MTVELEDYKYVMVFGKTGSGVSSTVNTLLGWNACQVSSGTHSQTQTIQVESRKGETMKVIDMPDLVNMDYEYKSDWKSREVLSRWRRVRLDAALLAIKSDERYTPEQYEIYMDMKEKLGDLISNDNLIIVFTHGEYFQEKCVHSAHDELQRVLNDAGNRYIALENSASGNDKEEIVCRLLTMVDRLRNPSAPERKPNRKHHAILPTPNAQNESLGWRCYLCIKSAVYIWILRPCCRFAQGVWTRFRSHFSRYR